MLQGYRKLDHYTKKLPAMLGGLLLGISMIPLTAVAAPRIVNCPNTYYQEPYNSNTIVPRGCPANTITQQRMIQGRLSANYAVVVRQIALPIYPYRGASNPNRIVAYRSVGNSVSPSLPSTKGNAIANVVLNPNGTVDVQLTNKTNATIAFEVIGHTQRRYLSGGQFTLLQGIPTPSTITFVRQDNGFVEVIPVSSSQGLLALDLDEDLNPLDNNQGAISIQRNGQVSFN
jgi:hypothetical protein